jgi:hypothetical protein
MHRYLAKLAEREDEMLDVKIITFMTDATDCDTVTRAENLVRSFFKAHQGIQLADFAVSSATVPGSSGMTRIANTLIIFYKHVKA